MKLAIAGAGIGGLSAALALSARGHEVVVCERASEQGEVGAGIQVSPNALRILDHLGVRRQFERVAVHPDRIVMRRWADDAELRTVPLTDAFVARYGYRYANVHRGDLVAVLATELERSHPRTQVVRSAQVVGVDTGVDSGTAALHLADGAAVEADIVVGADGIRSAVRGALFGATASRFSGAVAYRALVPRELLPDQDLEVTNRLGPDAHVVTYFVGADARWLNLVCVVPEATWDVESWTERGTVDDLRRAFAGWSTSLQRVLDRVEDPVFRWALHDRPPLERWGIGAVTLLGDACHPMLPFLAQGACQAIEDAATIGEVLDGLDERSPRGIAASLREYEALRQPRAARVQSASWRNRDVYHLPDGDGQRRRDAGFANAGGDLSMFDWLYGYRGPGRE